MANVINPEVKLLGFGPTVELEDGNYITPEEIVCGAAKITYQGMNALEEFIDLKKSGELSEESVRTTLIKVAGAGHASMATTPGFWATVGGNCSKFVDSFFTSARFGSFLMPSGRRVPISKGAVVIPKSIRRLGVEKDYLKASEKNIEVYEKIQERGVSKQEASKIVQYGHSGGGLMFMPLETLVYFSKLINNENSTDIPIENMEIVEQLENLVYENGMDAIYKARIAAPRTGCPNPNIFHSRVNFAEEMIGKCGLENLARQPAIVSLDHIPSQERDEKIREYLKVRESCFSSLDRIGLSWRDLLDNLGEIIGDFNDSLSVKIASLIPWRIWGEVKRHRTLPQTAESVYHAIERAEQILNKINGSKLGALEIDLLRSVVSLPKTVRSDSVNLQLWYNRFKDSLQTYRKLVENYVPEGDAVAVVPRGLKLGVVSNFDLYNLTLGYTSLRLCDTAEPEMRKITEQERRLVQGSAIPEEIKKLISPKCAYTGFCPELKGYCPRITPYVPQYEKDFHSKFQKERIEEIADLLARKLL